MCQKKCNEIIVTLVAEAIISTIRTRRWCLLYVNPNVTLEDTRLIKIVGTHGTVKMLILCVNLFVTLNKNRSRESLFTLWTVVMLTMSA